MYLPHKKNLMFPSNLGLSFVVTLNSCHFMICKNLLLSPVNFLIVSALSITGISLFKSTMHSAIR